MFNLRQSRKEHKELKKDISYNRDLAEAACSMMQYSGTYGVLKRGKRYEPTFNVTAGSKIVATLDCNLVNGSIKVNIPESHHTQVMLERFNRVRLKFSELKWTLTRKARAA